MKARLVKGLILLHVLGVAFCVVVAEKVHNWAPFAAAAWLVIFGAFLILYALPTAAMNDELDARHAQWAAERQAQAERRR